MIDIVLQDGYIEVIGDPAVPFYLKKALGYWHRVSVLDGYRRTMKNEWCNCFTTDTHINENGACEKLVTMPGLASRIKKTLTSHRTPFTLRDNRIPFPKPDIRKAMTGMRRSQVECVYTVLKSEGGIASAATGFGKSYIISSIIRAYDPADLQARNTPLSLITVKDKDICRQLYTKLSELFPDRDVGVLMSGKTKRSDDIQIVTLDSLSKIDMQQVGILIVDEVHEAATSTRAGELAGAIYARRWGMSATPDGRFDNADMATEGLVGPVVYTYTYQDGVRDGILVPIEVLWLEVPEPSTIHIGRYISLKDRLARYRHAAERNPGQNELIKEIIRRTPDSRQLLCMMQHADQMDILAGMLPDVPYVHAITDSKKIRKDCRKNIQAVTARERRKIYKGISDGEIRKVLATYVYKQGVDFPEVSVMVHASGGGSKIASAQIPGRGSRRHEGKDKTYLIDFWHPWDKKHNDEDKLVDGPVLRDDKARRRIYKKLGFTQIPVTGIDDLPFLDKA